MKTPPRKTPTPQSDVEFFRQQLDGIPSPEIHEFLWLTLRGMVGQLDLDSDWKRTIETHTDGVPEWAAKATAKVFENLFRPPKSKEAQSEDFKVGSHIGILKQLGDSTLQSISVKNFGGDLNLISSAQDQLSKMIPALISKFGQSSNALQAKVHKGLACGLDSVPVENKAYFFIATQWRKVAALETLDKIHKWLVSERCISQNAEPRNTHTMLKAIGYPFKRGRPKNK